MKQFSAEEANAAISQLTDGQDIHAQTFSAGRPDDDVGFLDRLNGTFGKTVLALGAAATLMVGIGRMGIDDYDDVTINEGSHYSIVHESRSGYLDLTRYVREDVLQRMDLEGLIPGHKEQVKQYSIDVTEDGVVRDICSAFVENTYHMGVQTESIKLDSACGLTVADLPVAKLQEASQNAMNARRFDELQEIVAQESTYLEQAAEFETFRQQFDAKYGDIEHADTVLAEQSWDKADELSGQYDKALKTAMAEHGEWKTEKSSERVRVTERAPKRSGISVAGAMKHSANANMRLMGHAMSGLSRSHSGTRSRMETKTTSQRVYDGPSEEQLLEMSPELKQLHEAKTAAWESYNEIDKDITQYQHLENGYQVSLKLPGYKAEIADFTATYGTAFDALVARNDARFEGAKDFVSEVQKGAGPVSQAISVVRKNHTPSNS